MTFYVARVGTDKLPGTKQHAVATKRFQRNWFWAREQHVDLQHYLLLVKNQFLINFVKDGDTCNVLHLSVHDTHPGILRKVLECMKLENFYVQTFKNRLPLLNTSPGSWLDDIWVQEVWKLGEVKPNPDELKNTCLLANCMNAWTNTVQ